MSDHTAERSGTTQRTPLPTRLLRDDNGFWVRGSSSSSSIYVSSSEAPTLWDQLTSQLGADFIVQGRPLRHEEGWSVDKDTVLSSEDNEDTFVTTLAGQLQALLSVKPTDPSFQSLSADAQLNLKLLQDVFISSDNLAYTEVYCKENDELQDLIIQHLLSGMVDTFKRHSAIKEDEELIRLLGLDEVKLGSEGKVDIKEAKKAGKIWCKSDDHESGQGQNGVTENYSPETPTQPDYEGASGSGTSRRARAAQKTYWEELILLLGPDLVAQRDTLIKWSKKLGNQSILSSKDRSHEVPLMAEKLRTLLTFKSDNPDYSKISDHSQTQLKLLQDALLGKRIPLIRNQAKLVSEGENIHFTIQHLVRGLVVKYDQFTMEQLLRSDDESGPPGFIKCLDLDNVDLGTKLVTCAKAKKVSTKWIKRDRSDPGNADPV